MRLQVSRYVDLFNIKSLGPLVEHMVVVSDADLEIPMTGPGFGYRAIPGIPGISIPIENSFGTSLTTFRISGSIFKHDPSYMTILDRKVETNFFNQNLLILNRY